MSILVTLPSSFTQDGVHMCHAEGWGPPAAPHYIRPSNHVADRLCKPTVLMCKYDCVLFNWYLKSKSAVIIILNKQLSILDFRCNMNAPLTKCFQDHNKACFWATDVLLLNESSEWFLFIKTASCIVSDWICVFEWIIWVNNKL